jgi:hypothetical protein
MAGNERDIEEALHREDAAVLAAKASAEELERLKAAEQLIELRHQRKKRSSRITMASSVLVGYVALAGFFANAYQSYANKQQQQKQAEIDQDRWNKEFERARRADRFRSFFEISLLATDAVNAGKRTVGYALLSEYVADESYNAKATLMLEEALSQELRSNREQGLAGDHRAAIIAIVTSLSQSPDCRALDKAAQTVNRVARRYALVDDLAESSEVFKVYVRRLLGRGVMACDKPADFRGVRKPLRDTLFRLPELGELKGKPTIASANTRLAELLRDVCADELSVSGVSDCPDVFRAYGRMCQGLEDPAEAKFAPDEKGGCAVMLPLAASLAPRPAVPAP